MASRVSNLGARVVGAVAGVATATVAALATGGDIPRPSEMPANPTQPVQMFTPFNMELVHKDDDLDVPVPVTNPGRFDDAFMNAKGLLSLDPIEGLRLGVDAPIPHHSHASRLELGVSVGNPEQPKPAHGTMMLQVSHPKEGYVIMGQIDTGLRSVARVAGPLTHATTANGQVSWDGEGSTEVALVDVISYEQNATYGGRYMYHVQAGNVVSGHYMQGIAPGLAAGIQSTYYLDNGRVQTELKLGTARERWATVANPHYIPNSKSYDPAPKATKKDIEKNNLRGRKASESPLMKTGRTTRDEFCFTATSNGTLSASYHRNVCRELAFASDVELQLSSARAVANVGLRHMTAHTTHSVVVSSEGIVHAVAQTKPTPVISVDVSTMLDHSSDKMKMGLGIKFGPNQPNF